MCKSPYGKVILLPGGCWDVELCTALTVQVRAMLMQQQKFVRRLDDEGLIPASLHQVSGEDVALRTNGEGIAANKHHLSTWFCR